MLLIPFGVIYNSPTAVTGFPSAIAWLLIAACLVAVLSNIAARARLDYHRLCVFATIFPFAIGASVFLICRFVNAGPEWACGRS